MLQSKVKSEDARGMYTPAEKMITLFGTADESTFVHESGHYFLDVMTDVAMRSDAPEQVRADIQTLDGLVRPQGPGRMERLIA